jgi:hypothetical protein
MVCRDLPADVTFKQNTLFKNGISSKVEKRFLAASVDSKFTRTMAGIEVDVGV